MRKAITNTTFNAASRAGFNVCVGDNGGPYHFGEYANGYYEAFKRLAASLETDTNYADMVFYPYAYIYRHAVELYLKGTLEVWHHIKNQKYDVRGHRLGDLISKFFVMCKDVPEMQGLDWDKLHQHVDDIHQLDKSGETFRYPVDLKNNRTIEGSGLYNLITLSEAATYCLEELDHVYCYSKHLYQQHMEALHG